MNAVPPMQICGMEEHRPTDQPCRAPKKTNMDTIDHRRTVLKYGLPIAMYLRAGQTRMPLPVGERSLAGAAMIWLSAGTAR